MSLDRYPVDGTKFDGPVLVTGAGGCIGAWALALLERAGVPTVAFDLSDDRRRPKLLMPDETADALPWETGDIADSDRVMEVVKSHDIRAIIHLAALQGALLQSRSDQRRQGQCGRHGERVRGSARSELEARRLCKLDRSSQLLSRSKLAADALWRV